MACSFLSSLSLTQHCFAYILMVPGPLGLTDPAISVFSDFSYLAVSSSLNYCVVPLPFFQLCVSYPSTRGHYHLRYFDYLGILVFSTTSILFSSLHLIKND